MSLTVNTGEVLPASECKRFFELGTEPLVAHFTAISNCKTATRLYHLLADYHKGRLQELKAQLAELRDRLAGLEAMPVTTTSDAAQFAIQQAASIARLKQRIDATIEQIAFVKYEKSRTKEVSDQQLFAYKTLANAFLAARQKVLDTWDVNYAANPLTMCDDLDHETIAVPVDGRDMGAWINDLLDKSLREI